MFSLVRRVAPRVFTQVARPMGAAADSHKPLDTMRHPPPTGMFIHFFHLVYLVLTFASHYFALFVIETHMIHV
jgi:hypothetical protein